MTDTARTSRTGVPADPWRKLAGAVYPARWERAESKGASRCPSPQSL
jgi:hypothetical protein